MERFVFVSAIAFAVIFGLWAMFANGAMFNHAFHFDVDTDGHGAAPIVETTAGRFEPQVFQGAELRLKHLAAVVVITPEDRADFLIEIDNPGGAPMPTVSADGGQVTVDGQLRGRISGCADDGGAELRGYDDVTLAQLPRITIRAPRTLDIERSGAGTTAIGAAESVKFELAGCGDATLADVANLLSLEAAGVGDVETGALGRLEADIAGAGNISVGAVTQAADIDMAGAGSFTIASLTGDLTVSSAGAGDLIVSGGSVAVADLDLAGAGNVRIAAPVSSLTVQIVGVSDVDVAGVVGQLDAEIAGPGNVSVQSVTGSVRQEIAGPGSVDIGSR